MYIIHLGGERGIRTLGAVAHTLPFQGSRLNHSRISPSGPTIYT